MVRLDDSAAFASNWRVVLATDAALGLLVAVVGIVVAIAVNVAFGVVMALAGAVYIVLVAVRARRWAVLRRQAGS